MFNRIWKEQIVKPTSKVGIFKPKEGFDLEEENKDEDCCEKAKEFFDKKAILHFPGGHYTSKYIGWDCDRHTLEWAKEFMSNISHNTGLYTLWHETILEWERCEKNV